MSESFQEIVAGTLYEAGFETVQIDEDRVLAILDDETTARLSLFEIEAEMELPAIAIRASAVVGVSTEDPEQALEVLLAINRLNSEQWLGKWYYQDRQKAVFMEHVLLQESLNGAELAKTALAIELLVDLNGRKLVERLGRGSTDVDFRKAWEERRGIA